MSQKENSNKVIQHLGELMTCLDNGFQDKAWNTMENVNEEMLSLLTGLDRQQLQNPDINQSLKKIQEKFDTWIEACNEYKVQFANELLINQQKEHGLRSYQSTNRMREE